VTFESICDSCAPQDEEAPNHHYPEILPFLLTPLFLGNYSLAILPQLFAILAVFSLLGLTLWWFRRNGALQFRSCLPPRFSPPRSRSQIRLLARVEGLQLSPTHSLSLIRLADRAILIGTSPAGFYLVDSSSWKALEAQAKESQP
jgi:flagellar biogenesis protein FliO